MFAEVYVNLGVTKMDHPFTYRIPEELLDVVKPGSEVTVPMRGRNLRGFVMTVEEKCEIDEKAVRDIISAKSPGQDEGEMFALAGFIRQRYGGTLGQALSVVFPSDANAAVKTEKIVKRTGDIDTALDELLSKKRHSKYTEKLLTILKSNESILWNDLRQDYDIPSNTIREAEKQGLVSVVTHTSLRNPFEKLGLESERPDISLNDKQSEILSDFLKNRPAVSLIHGVTGSGKTLLYIAMIEQVLKAGKQAIVLIPEIALTLQNIMRFYRFFGDRISCVNSRMNPSLRNDQFERARAGEISVMIGPRSALFTPFSNLGLIIVDEEHETSYISEHPPKYHAVEVAVERGRLAGAQVVLGSASPSVNSYFHAVNKDYKLYTLEKRANDAALPTVSIVDMREELKSGNRSVLSRKLYSAIKERLEKKEQVMLFINRRGVAGTVSCRECGAVIKCEHCDVPMSLHKDGFLHCHYCGAKRPMVQECPVCHSRLIGTMRAGTEKIESEIKRLFPAAGVVRMDADTTKGAGGFRDILKAFNDRKADILIGTQMIVKGHDFPGVTLMGVLAADLSLNVPDYRATERTFDLLLQACGRSGRGEVQGEAVIQTYQPENFAIVSAAENDYGYFFKEETAFRKLVQYPPFSHMLSVEVTSRSDEGAVAMGGYIAEKLAKAFPGLLVSGPNPAPVVKIKDIYRYYVVIKDTDYEKLIEARKLLDEAITEDGAPKNADLWYDFD
ncbi:MAG: primosomal protein N' [Candidatus Weimeria sp.]